MSILMQIQGRLNQAKQWLFKTPERALDQAYEAGVMIEAIEKEYFGGNPISTSYGNYGQSAQAYFKRELSACLRTIKVRMKEFTVSSSILRISDLRISDHRITEVQLSDQTQDDYTVDIIDKPAVVLKKLRFIDQILARYQVEAERSATRVTISNDRSTDHSLLNQPQARRQTDQSVGLESRSEITPAAHNKAQAELESTSEALSDRASFLPRSILRTVDRIKQDLDPKAEADVVRNFRSSKTKTTLALKFILLLIIVPLLTQQFSKNIIISPIVDYFRTQADAEVFLNLEMEEDALHELQRFDERLRFEVLIGKVAPLDELEIEETVREKAFEIEEVYRHRSADAVKNVFADILAVAAFMLLLITSKREVAVLKSFIDEIIYGLSDSAKAFIIILFTDIFVGFHSPHG
ncbi:MAG: proton extrusion protein PcxA, partial [Pseudanabaenales cyanobacterium]|nr:proton extrusion protein PcxA [Pseudanabaenales cyanobacterium]